MVKEILLQRIYKILVTKLKLISKQKPRIIRLEHLKNGNIHHDKMAAIN